jgi:hypothetical protein
MSGREILLGIRTRQPRRNPVPLNAQDISSWRWVPHYYLYIITSADAILFVAGGLLVGILSYFSHRIEAGGVVELLGIAALGVTALAVTITALSIFVLLADDAYVRTMALNKQIDRVGRSMIPFIWSAFIDTLTVVVAVLAAIIYSALPQWADALLLGFAAGLAFWSIWGLLQITVDLVVLELNRLSLVEASMAAGSSIDDPIPDVMKDSGEGGSSAGTAEHEIGEQPDDSPTNASAEPNGPNGPSTVA